MNPPTLTEALAALGYTHRKRHGCLAGRRNIVDAQGNTVAELSAREGWMFVRDVEAGLPVDEVFRCSCRPCSLGEVTP